MSHLRLDPTRTTRLRAMFNSALNTRFELFKRELKQHLIQGDALGIWASRPKLLFNAGEYRFLTDDRKLAALKGWLKFRVGQLFLKNEHDDSAQSWLGAYVKQAYQRGLKRAFDDWKKPTGVIMMPTAAGEAYQKGRYAEFMRQSFGGPTPLERVRALASRTFNDIEGVTESMSTSITRLLLDAMATGTNPREVGSALNRIVDGHKRRGTAIARTECLPGDTLVDSAVIRAVFRRWYVGPMVKVKTSSGREFSATPNHPMLTKDGWVAAGELQQSDDLICHNGQEHARSSGNPDINHSPATLSEIFSSVSSIGSFSIKREATTASDFHGDGLNGEVDVLSPNGELRIGNFAPLYEPLLENVFSFTGKSASSFCSFCGRLLSVNEQPCLCRSSSDLARIFEPFRNQMPANAETLFNGAGRFPSLISVNDLLGIQVGSEPGVDSTFVKVKPSFRQRSTSVLFSKNVANSLLVDSGFSGDLPLGQPSSVCLDNVLSIEFYSFAGHVYNLQTPYGYYTINGSLYTGNTIRAFNEGALDGLENLGATKIGVMVEWSTSGMGLTKLGNPSPCPKCKELAGIVLTVEEARGLLPRHPNCMCSFIPANVGEKTDKQVHDAKRIREAVMRSAGNEKWIGAKKKFTSKGDA